MGGRTALVKATHFKCRKSRLAMRATIGVWSPTLLEGTLHSVPASLLVSVFTLSWNENITVHGIYSQAHQ